MIIYLDDWKLAYNDYTLKDAITLVESYANEYKEKEWKIYNNDGDLCMEGRFA